MRRSACLLDQLANDQSVPGGVRRCQPLAGERVDVRAGGGQDLHDLVVGSEMERHHPRGVADVGARASPGEQPGQLRVGQHGGEMQRSHLALGAGIRIRTTIEEQPSGLQLAGDGRSVQRCQAPVVARIHEVTGCEPLLEGRDVAPLGGAMEGGDAGSGIGCPLALGLRQRSFRWSHRRQHDRHRRCDHGSSGAGWHREEAFLVRRGPRRHLGMAA